MKEKTTYFAIKNSLGYFYGDRNFEEVKDLIAAKFFKTKGAAQKEANRLNKEWNGRKTWEVFEVDWDDLVQKYAPKIS